MNIVSYIGPGNYVARLNFAISIHPNSIFILKNRYGMAGESDSTPELSVLNDDIMFILRYLKQGRPGRQHALQDALQRYLNIQS